MFAEDLSVFMNVAEFATSVTLNGAPVAALFDAPGALGSVGAYGMATSAPQLTLATAAVPASPVGLAVVAAGVNYLVAEHVPDGTGISVLLLERAA